MGDYMHLIGTENIRSAAQMMQSAGEEMQSAASHYEDIFLRHQQFMDDWLLRLEMTLKSEKEEK